MFLVQHLVLAGVVLSVRGGFTMVEVIVALVILSTAVLGLAISASSLTASAAIAELQVRALHAAEDRIARIEADGRYAALDSIYAGVEDDLAFAPGFTRTTTVEHVNVTEPSPLDYKIVTVIVEGDWPIDPVERSLVVAAP